MYGKRTILFVDEIHRFNKGQQDYLLPFVEDGTLVLIGATTENPYFEVNGALLSRSKVFELKPLEKEDIKKLILRAVTDSERGMGAYDVCMDEEAADFLAEAADAMPVCTQCCRAWCADNGAFCRRENPLYDRRGIRVYPETCDPLR